jgi:hypothetical protein
LRVFASSLYTRTFMVSSVLIGSSMGYVVA